MGKFAKSRKKGGIRGVMSVPRKCNRAQKALQDYECIRAGAKKNQNGNEMETFACHATFRKIKDREE